MFPLNSEVTLDNSNDASNPDDSSSISNIKSEISSLVKRKFELETQIASTQPQKFGNVLDVLGVTVPLSLNVNYREESQRLHFSKKLHFYKLCDHMEVTKHFLPPMVPLEELIENYLKNSSKISGFFRKIYHYIVVYDNRISQMNDLKVCPTSWKKKIDIPKIKVIFKNPELANQKAIMYHRCNDRPHLLIT
ncbi:hypothetical protein J437_LFUL000365 [Ladona fulva]|uniref:Uncharacterized protein n=1 Tax=Ladona fulva TaxID=123851 RepID=A0A8K0JVY5_LADFU|nr:hypothetical protein J437_LFUL000365 [Ladona fulva]